MITVINVARMNMWRGRKGELGEVSIGNALVDIVRSVDRLPREENGESPPRGEVPLPLPLHQHRQQLPRAHALPLSARLPGHAVRVLEAVDVGQVHVLGDAGHVRRVQLFVAVRTPAEVE